MDKQKKKSIDTQISSLFVRIFYVSCCLVLSKRILLQNAHKTVHELKYVVSCGMPSHGRSSYYKMCAIVGTEPATG